MPQEWGRRRGRGRGAGGPGLFGTCCFLILTFASAPTLSCHHCYGWLPSKQDTWGTNIKCKSASNSTWSWHQLLKDHARAFLKNVIHCLLQIIQLPNIIHNTFQVNIISLIKHSVVHCQLDILPSHIQSRRLLGEKPILHSSIICISSHYICLDIFWLLEWSLAHTFHSIFQFEIS